MSALAARRAAAASAACSAPSSSASPVPAPATTTPTSSKQKQKQKRDLTPKTKSTPRKAPTPVIALDESDDDDDRASSDSPGSFVPTPKRQKVSRQKIPTQSASRYFAPPAQSGKLRERERFSPSAPVILLDDEEEEEEEEEQDSSDGESDDGVLSNDEVYAAATEDVEEGRALWSVSEPTTPGPSQTSRPIASAGTSSQTITSNLEAIKDQNIHFVSEERLRDAGLDDYGPGVVISLKNEETLVIAGMYTLTPLQSSLSILSTTLSPSPTSSSHYPISAPTSHPIPIISPSSSNTKTTSNASIFLSRLSLPSTFKVSERGKPRTVFLIRENRCGLDDLRGGAVPGFGHIWMEEVGAWGLKNIHPVIGSFPTPVYPYTTPASWTKALSNSSTTADGNLNGEVEEAETEPAIALVRGPKRTGKSTFGRALLNSSLGKYERVAWLECDLGQGEFTCGGMVGLWILDKRQFGPTFTHPLIPVQAYYLGTYTPLTCPDEYISSISKLIEYYKYEIQYSSSPSSSISNLDNAEGKIKEVVPLIVNTQGWIKGLGEELLRFIEGMVDPTDIYDLQPLPLEDDYNHPLTPGQQNGDAGGWTTSPQYVHSQLPTTTTTARAKIHILEPAPLSPLLARYTASDFRTLSLLTYFYSSQRPSSSSSSTSNSETKWDFSSPLMAQNPWMANLSSSSSNYIHGNESETQGEGEVEVEGGIKRVYQIGEGSEGIPSSDLSLALNGSIVALLETNFFAEEAEDEDDQGRGRGRLYVPGRAPPPESRTIGLAIIRAIRPTAPQASSGNGEDYQVQILTPVPIRELRKCNAIVKNGAVELPLHGLMDYRNPPLKQEQQDALGEGDGKGIPFIDDSGVNVVAGERRRFRRNLMRKGM